MNEKVLKRFVINLAILTFVMFTVWALIRSFSNRAPGDYETTVCDNRLKDKLYDKAIKAAETALDKMPSRFHRYRNLPSAKVMWSRARGCFCGRL